MLSESNIFHFKILRIKIPDYFILAGFDNIVDLKPLRLWIIKSDEIVGTCSIKDSASVEVYNDPEPLKGLRNMRTRDKLKRLDKICNDLRLKKGMESITDKRLHRNYILSAIYHLKELGKYEILSRMLRTLQISRMIIDKMKKLVAQYISSRI